MIEIKIIIIGDLHYKAVNPRNRIDDYKTALNDKLNQVGGLIKKHSVDLVIMTGDIFDAPVVAIPTLTELSEILRLWECEVLTTAGNHDIFGYNIESYYRTSLLLLEKITPNLIVKNDPKDVYIKKDSVISCQPFTDEVDENNFGYEFPEISTNLGFTKIKVVHGMLVDHDPPFNKFTNILRLKTSADVIVSGHDHVGYGYKQYDDTQYINPGSLGRMSASKTELTRDIKVGLLDTKTKDFEFIKLSVKPGEEVLDRSKIEEAEERKYAMETFTAILQNKSKKTSINIDEILKEVASFENIDQNLVTKAKERILEMKNELQISEEEI